MYNWTNDITFPFFFFFFFFNNVVLTYLPEGNGTNLTTGRIIVPAWVSTRATRTWPSEPGNNSTTPGKGWALIINDDYHIINVDRGCTSSPLRPFL